MKQIKSINEWNMEDVKNFIYEKLQELEFKNTFEYENIEITKMIHILKFCIFCLSQYYTIDSLIQIKLLISNMYPELF